MARDDPEIRFRAPDAVKAELERAARANGRSLNAEVLTRLIRSVEAGDTPMGIVQRLHWHAGSLNSLAAYLADPEIQKALRASPVLEALSTPTAAERKQREAEMSIPDIEEVASPQRPSSRRRVTR